jgi:hypothetical protein
MPSPRQIAEATSRPGFISPEAENFVREQDRDQPRDRDTCAYPVNPSEPSAPAKNLKEG